MYRKINGTWLITEHHSSAMPEPVANPIEEVAALFEKWNDALQVRRHRCGAVCCEGRVL